jgi:pyruvate/2-oxoglutarate dehydrogenase complex dihydrolipoamide dehydrogenase (E3) component
MALKELPKRLTIIGGGYIGLEFASMYNLFGSKVSVLQVEDSFIPREDRDLADAISLEFS